MIKDPTEFRKRFVAWKNGKLPYKGGRPSAIQVVDPLNRAIINKDYVPMKTELDAIWFGPNYKEYYPKFKDGKLPGYEDGKPVTVGEYKVYPSAIGASELNVTTPEIVVTGKDRRPLYLRYAAERSTYDPNAIRNFTELIPIAGDVQQGVLAVDEYNKGNYLYAGILGGGLFLPNVLEKPLKYGLKSAKSFLQPVASGLKDFSYKGDTNKIKEYIFNSILNGNEDDITKSMYPDYLGKNYTQYPSYVTSELYNSTYPRMRKMRPWFTDAQFDSAFKYAADGKYTIFPTKTFDAAGRKHTAGFYMPGKDFIAIKAGQVEFALPHEIRHKIDNAVPLIQEEENILKEAFGDEFMDMPKGGSEFAKELGLDYDMNPERVTTNRDARSVLLGAYHSQHTPVELLNKIIQRSSDDAIFDAVSLSNGYGQEYIDVLKKKGKLTPRKALQFRNSMMKVGILTGLGYTGVSKLNPLLQTNTQNELRNK